MTDAQKKEWQIAMCLACRKEAIQKRDKAYIRRCNKLLKHLLKPSPR
jgi:hypothetical protein